MKNKKTLFVLAAAMFLVACGVPSVSSSSSAAESSSSSVSSESSTSTADSTSTSSEASASSASSESSTSSVSSESSASSSSEAPVSSSSEAPVSSSSEAPVSSSSEAPVSSSSEAPHEHAYGEWTVTKEATCTEEGSKEKVCACGDKVVEAIPATGHTYGEWRVAKEATCTEEGSKEKVCACGDKVVEAIPATGHTWGEGTLVPAADSSVMAYKQSLCSADQNMKLSFTARDGKKSADGILKDDTNFPETMKLNTKGDSMTYNFKFNRNGTGKMYMLARMDSWSGNKTKTFFTVKDANNKDGNFKMEMNGKTIDISDKKTVTFEQMFKTADATNSSYSAEALVEVGAVDVVAGDNTFNFLRVDSYNPLISEFVIILDEYSDEIEAKPTPDSSLEFTGDDGVDLEWSDIYIEKESGNFYFLEQADLYDAEWVYEDGDKIFINKIVCQPGFVVDTVTIDGNVVEGTEVPDGRGTKTVYEYTITSAGKHTVHVTTKAETDTTLAVIADEHVTSWIASAQGEESFEYAAWNFTMDGREYPDKATADVKFEEGMALTFSCVVEEGYTIDSIKIGDYELEWDGADNAYGAYVEIPGAGDYTIVVTTKVASDSSLTLDLDDNCTDETYVYLMQDGKMFNFFAHGGYDAKWSYVEGEEIYIQPAHEDGYTTDAVTVDGNAAEYIGLDDDGYPTYKATLAAAGNHTVSVTSKEVEPDTTLSVTVDDHVTMWCASIDGEDSSDYAAWNFTMDGQEYPDKATAEVTFEEGMTMMFSCVVEEGYTIDSIKIGDYELEWDGADNAYGAFIEVPAAGEYTITVTTKVASDSSLKLDLDENCTDETYVYLMQDGEMFNFFAHGGYDAKWSYVEGEEIYIQPAHEYGYTTDTVTVDGEEAEYIGLDDDGYPTYKATLAESGEHTVVVTSKEAEADTTYALSCDAGVQMAYVNITDDDNVDETLTYGVVIDGNATPDCLSTEFVFCDWIEFNISAEIKEGFVVDALIIDGVEIDADEYEVDEGVLSYSGEVEDKGEHTIQIKTKTEFTESEVGEGEVEEW